MTADIFVFTRYGMGDGDADLQKTLAGKFLKLLGETGNLPSAILFYTDGVKLACAGSPALEELRQLEQKGVRLILCQTCLQFYGLTPEVGVVGGMGDIIAAMQRAQKAVSL